MPITSGMDKQTQGFRCVSNISVSPHHRLCEGERSDMARNTSGLTHPIDRDAHDCECESFETYFRQALHGHVQATDSQVLLPYLKRCQSFPAWTNKLKVFSAWTIFPFHPGYSPPPTLRGFQNFSKLKCSHPYHPPSCRDSLVPRPA